MTPNRSTAVMQRREPTGAGEYGPRGFPKSLDYFPTPPWAARAACAFLREELGEDIANQLAWEPACGEGHMTRGLQDCFGTVVSSDVHDFGGNLVHDFLQPFLPPGVLQPPAWIFTNPPFRLAAPFIRRGLEEATRGVAMFVRGAFTEGDERYHAMFAPDVRPSYVVTYCERVVLLRDRLIRSGAPDPFNLGDDGQPRRASSAASYSLVIWQPGQNDTRHRWIPQCRTRMEREGDYPAYAEQWAAIAAAHQGGLL